MSQQEIEGYCPKCMTMKWSKIMSSWTNSWYDQKQGVDGTSIHRILVCKSCNSDFYQLERTFSENTDFIEDGDGHVQMVYIPEFDYYPAAHKHPRPSWLLDIRAKDSQLENILNEVYSALDHDMPILAAAGIRTAFDQATKVLNIEPSRSFTAKLDDLLVAGEISQKERQDLNVLVDAGSAAAHRSWRPTPSLLSMLVNHLESFMKRTIVSSGSLASIKDDIPRRQKSDSQRRK